MDESLWELRHAVTKSSNVVPAVFAAFVSEPSGTIRKATFERIPPEFNAAAALGLGVDGSKSESAHA